MQREGSYERDCGGGGGGFEDRKQDGSDRHTRSRDRDHWEHDLYENEGEEDDREGGGGGGDYSHVEPGPVVMLRNLRDDVHKEDVRESRVPGCVGCTVVWFVYASVGE